VADGTKLFIIDTLRRISLALLGGFLVMYFLQLGSDTIYPIAAMYLIMWIVAVLVFYVTRNLVNRGNKLVPIRISTILLLAIYVFVIFTRHHIIDFFWVIGILRGLEVGFYHTSFNQMKSTIISNKSRLWFLSIGQIRTGIIDIFLPILFGFMLLRLEYHYVAIVMAFICAISFLFSLCLKDKSPKLGKTNIPLFMKTFSENKKIKKVMWVAFFSGLTYNASAFTLMITIYTALVLGSTFHFGMAAALYSVLGMVASLLVAKFGKENNFKTLSWSAVLIILSTFFFMVFNTDIYTVIIFACINAFFIVFASAFVSKNIYDYSNLDCVKDKHKTEYFFIIEVFRCLGRVLGLVLLILTAVFSSTLFLQISMVLIGLMFIPLVFINNRLGMSA